jgi:regulator of protease activity HflC (stomatin/prohibitin superfamily)
MVFVEVLLAVVALAAGWFALSGKVIKQYERGLVFRFGRVLPGIRGPGLNMIIPVIDRLRKVNMQIVTMPVPAQDGITRDNVTVKVDAVVYFNVSDPVRAIVNVQDYLFAVGQVAQTSLRSMIGKSELDDLLSNRERLNQGLEVMIDSPALDWGIHIDRVEIKDVALPDAMKRSMSRQAEAERERRARVITADGELQASQKLSQAAATMADTPTALQLRLLQTVVEVAAEKNSTVVLPFPVELLRFLEAHTPYRVAEATDRKAAGQPGDGKIADDQRDRRSVEARPDSPAAVEASGPDPLVRSRPSLEAIGSDTDSARVSADAPPGERARAGRTEAGAEPSGS